MKVSISLYECKKKFKLWVIKNLVCVEACHPERREGSALA